MAAMKICSEIWSLAIIVAGLGLPHGQAHAQAPRCMVMEVIVEERAALAETFAAVVDQRGKEKRPRSARQQAKTQALIVSPSTRNADDLKRGSTVIDEAATNSSTREKAFASGQDLSNYCSFKIETDTER